MVLPAGWDSGHIRRVSAEGGRQAAGVNEKVGERGSLQRLMRCPAVMAVSPQINTT